MSPDEEDALSSLISPVQAKGQRNIIAAMLMIRMSHTPYNDSDRCDAFREADLLIKYGRDHPPRL